MSNTSRGEESEFTRWARAELESAGLFDSDSDYEGRLGDAVMGLIYTFNDQGHSGFSATMAGSIFHELIQWKPLGPISQRPEEWMDVSYESGATMYQNLRDGACFSDDKVNYWSVNDTKLPWYKRWFTTTSSHGTKMYKAVPVGG